MRRDLVRQECCVDRYDLGRDAGGWTERPVLAPGEGRLDARGLDGLDLQLGRELGDLGVHQGRVEFDQDIVASDEASFLDGDAPDLSVFERPDDLHLSGGDDAPRSRRGQLDLRDRRPGQGGRRERRKAQ